MTSILGRMATYSGKEVEWDKAIASEISIMPDSFEWDAPTKSVPGPDGLYPHPIPGQSILV